MSEIASNFGVNLFADIAIEWIVEFSDLDGTGTEFALSNVDIGPMVVDPPPPPPVPEPGTLGLLIAGLAASQFFRLARGRK